MEGINFTEILMAAKTAGVKVIIEIDDEIIDLKFYGTAFAHLSAITKETLERPDLFMSGVIMTIGHVRKANWVESTNYQPH